MKRKLNNIKLVAFDLDGTIYYGKELIEGAKETVEYFRKLGKRVVFLTNNSTKSRKSILRRLCSIGIECNKEDVFSAGYISALHSKNEELQNIYIYGSTDLIEEFQELGIDCVDSVKAENLVIGYKPSMSYKDLTEAIQVGFKANIIIACNKERTFLGGNKEIMPGCGAMVAPIEHCLNRKSDFVVGKPNTLMLDIIKDFYSLKSNEVLMIGDTYESDIMMAKNSNVLGILINKSNIKYDCIMVKNIDEIIDLFI